MFDTFEGLTELENAMNEFINLIKETSNVTEIKIDGFKNCTNLLLIF